MGVVRLRVKKLVAGLADIDNLSNLKVLHIIYH